MLSKPLPFLPGGRKMAASKLNLNSCCINDAHVHPAFIIPYFAKSNPITVLRNMSTSLFALFVYLSGKKNVFLCIVFFLCPALLSQSSVFPVISISECLLFFSCNQTRRFIYVALKHHRNQLPSALPRRRAAHLYIHCIHPHTRWNAGAHDTHAHTHTQRCKHAGRWFTTSLFSNVLLASSLQHPFVFADRSWQQHLSMLPLPSLRQPTPLLSTPTSSPCWTHSCFQSFWEKNRDRILCTWMVAVVTRHAWGVPDTAVKRWSVISVSKDSVWWIVKEDSAQEGV